MQHLEECLLSLSKQTTKDFEIILVDNGSMDGSADYAEKNFPYAKIVRLNKNEGFCGGNNIGLEHAKGEFIALLNNDTKVDPRWLEELLREMRRDPKIGICSSCMLNYFKPEYIDTAGDGYDICGVGFKVGNQVRVSEYQNKRLTFGACAGAAMYRRSMIDKIGFFDEDFFAVGEDIDLSFRARLSGYRCVYVPTAIVHHKINQTVGASSDFLLYQSRRNIEYTYFKNMPTPLLILTLPLHLLYNLLTLIQALAERRTGIYLKAKKDFFRNFSKVMNKRTEIQKQRKITLISLLNSFSKNYLFEKSISEVCGNRNG